MAPQNSGNGPDVTRSPMAQERGMDILILAIFEWNDVLNTVLNTCSVIEQITH